MRFQGLHPRGIQTSGLGGKLIHLGRGKAAEDVAARLVSGEPLMMGDQGFEMGQRRAACVLLEGVPGGGSRLSSRRCPQPIDLLAALRT